ncbi:MAG: biotin--[acetyl-CoA-carboxylase] ligase [Candidatus Thorarchaeota archaeon]|nr:biotin--[acetyl-CoA-carboxylase] ligase [Candidatus Thorarchaeota archaeon]
MQTLDEEAIAEAIHAQTLVPRVIVLESVSSTSDYLRDLVLRGADEGTYVLATMQTAGKGRRNRVWHSPVGGLYASVSIRPRVALEQSPLLGFLVACSTVAAVKRVTGVELQIKWPNDLVIDGLKIGGVLSELVTHRECVMAVIGVGLNVNTPLESLPAQQAPEATSLSVWTSAQTPLAALASAVFEEIDKRVCMVDRALSFDRVMDEWAHHCTTLGRRVRIEYGGDQIVGTAIGFRGDGALRVSTDTGALVSIEVGDVVHLRPVS